jgi:hypothetical protein
VRRARRQHDQSLPGQVGYEVAGIQVQALHDEPLAVRQRLQS